jgi:acrylyl-CoA reductase (NADPH)
MFKALVLESADGTVSASVRELAESTLPAGNVTVAVEYSTVNFKDGMIVCGVGGLVKTYPHVPGVDFAGTVIDSSHPNYRPGDKVVLTGWRCGEIQWGGLAQKAVVNGDWLVPLPLGITTGQAMAIGTAGLTAMLAVLALQAHGLTAGASEVLVTGAAGGVGSVAVALLAKLGYTVIASTGRPAQAAYLTGLGAAEVIDRKELTGPPRALAKERWAGGIDAVGSTTLANVLSMTRYRGAVAACGLAGGMDLPTTVAPFILRGVSLIGIDSVMCPIALRQEAWRRLETDLDRGKIAAMTSEIGLADVIDAGARIVAGAVRGRTVVKIR